MDILKQIKEALINTDISNTNWLLILFVLACVDVVTGIVNAWMEGNIQSAKMKKGILGKMYELVIVLIGGMLDYVLGLNVIIKSTIIFYSIQEVTSILENTAMHISYPKFIKDALDVLNKQKDGV